MPLAMAGAAVLPSLARTGSGAGVRAGLRCSITLPGELARASSSYLNHHRRYHHQHHRLLLPRLWCSLPRSSFLAWNGHSILGSPLRLLDCSMSTKRRFQNVVEASLLGVGAPEALVIAVVALLVFGPKGLAEVARTVGKSLRAFQPTIRELQQISRDFKDTLEQEIGLDELRASDVQPSKGGSKLDQNSPASVSQNGPSELKAYSTEDYVRVTEEQVKALVPEEQRKAAEAAAWGGAPPTPQAEVPEELKTSSEEPKSSNVGQTQ